MNRALGTLISTVMRSAIDIDEALLTRATELTGVSDKTALVRMGLDALISRHSATQLATLGGTEKKLRPVRRRRSSRRGIGE